MKHLLLTTIAAVLVVGCAKPPPPDIPIHEAIFDGNIEAVKQHLAAGTDVNAKDDSFGGTPLHYAAMEGHMEIVELLITKGADVNAKDDGGATPLDLAILNHHTETTDLLRKHVKAPDISIHDAAREGNIEAVKQHLAAGADMNAKNDRGVTPLLYAIIGGDYGIVELLITKGADVNAFMDSLGRTTLHYAASGGYNKEVVELLIAAGADVNAKTKGGDTPLHNAAWEGNKEIVELLVASGADVNAKDKKGWTPLHEAANKKGHKEIVELLIAAGADVNAMDEDGKKGYASTPLDWANGYGRTEIADLLRKHGGKTGKELRGR